jgi:hypothetical protein
VSVSQVKQYYIYLEFKEPIPLEDSVEVDFILEEEGCLNWEFQDNKRVLVVDGFEDEMDALQVENEIYNLLREYVK